MAGARFNDGSGLTARTRLTADLLTALLARAGDPGRPELRPVLTGLPVAGFTGTLDEPLRRTRAARPVWSAPRPAP